MTKCLKDVNVVLWVKISLPNERLTGIKWKSEFLRKISGSDEKNDMLLFEFSRLTRTKNSWANFCSNIDVLKLQNSVEVISSVEVRISDRYAAQSFLLPPKLAIPEIASYINGIEISIYRTKDHHRS